MENGNIGDIFGQVSRNINKAYIMRHINEHIKRQENATWLNEISRQEARRGNGRNKLRTYKLLKNDYAKETYVQIFMQRTHRSANAKFRMGLAPLRIETGRYDILEEENRLCFICNDEVESEEHVLLHCPLYQDVREILFTKIAYSIPGFCFKSNQEKLVCIFSCDIIPMIRISAKICNDILVARCKHFYRWSL